MSSVGRLQRCKMCGVSPLVSTCYRPSHFKVYCETCDEKFKINASLKKHEATSMHKLKMSLSCEIKKADWEKVEEVDERLRRNYPNLKQSTIQLERLPEEAIISLILKKKNQMKDPVFKCPTCDKEFIYMTSLKIHEREHQKEKKWKLQGLLSSFADEDGGENICKICKREFPSKTYLKIHKSVHY